MIIVNNNSFTLPLLPLQKGKQAPQDGIAEKDRVFVRLHESNDLSWRIYNAENYRPITTLSIIDKVF